MAGNSPGSVAGPTERLTAAVRRALDRFAVSPDSRVIAINQSENTTYRIDDPDSGKSAILRVHRVGYQTIEAIRSELAWTAAVREEAGIETPRPIAAKDGTVIQVIDSEHLPHPRLAVMFHFIEGEEPSPDQLVRGFEQLGAITARMHRQSAAWPRPNGFTRQVWDFDTTFGSRPIWGRWQAGLGLDAAGTRLLERMTRTIECRLERFGKTQERFGLVHADLRLANLLVHDGATKVIDFDDCGFSWYLYDLATALSFIEHRPDVPDLVDAWLRGYHRIGSLTADDRAEIPTFFMMRRLLLVAWIGSHQETKLAQELGAEFTRATYDLAEAYLGRFD
jgi:Ser/Thr protein kinase RdoA (MazF antagonist)